METDKWGRRIRAFRKLKGFTQESLAKELSISVSVLGEVERGSRIPKEDFLENVAEVLDIPLNDLIPQEESDRSE
ncbi:MULTISPECIES: helix-turn-helix domain-containing protein [Rossellomorea]|jgi:transcriptional regulator with XRE-family HTH domain|uniref:Helix-turn-helix domain-containing protein n=1 Tax=Rossellomorea vietnamensis TaxID=218284 RepID=A0A6I6UM62_9BACI|nr:MULTISPECIES: helix-turn-helix transcriptional regulator [Rossellomorea]MCA0151225.1 helix-turn-helix domain-containing protein [Rossellomorea vietnamensis]MCC5804309.1 helix-turn-helix transcriptional regulator [Rossellomorea vietnamensis]QHE59702.1 helix-turn-helix domain-containing protein [Rossellomorea vietnamensis]WGG45769.1 helix-turn-helix transcriptional regulator [Rossellomorea sp. DA94]WQI94326.1 helix-turn-helix transcriptional regulator [Rossellomorea vietnamensis]